MSKQNPVSPKAYGAGVGAALGAVLAWILEVALGEPVPDAVKGALGVVCAFALAYLLPDPLRNTS